MSTSYNGNAGNIGAATPVTITIPQDGVDTLAVSTVNVPQQKLADYIAYLEQQALGGVFYFSGLAGNAASTSYFMFAESAASPGTAGPTTSSWANGTRLLIPVAMKIRNVYISTTQATAGGVVSAGVTLSSGGFSTSSSHAAGFAAQVFNETNGAGWSVAAGDYITGSVGNLSGVTASMGSVVMACVWTWQ